MKIGEKWKVRPCAVEYAKKRPRFIITESMSTREDTLWRVEYLEGGGWDIWGSSYIYENYERYYDSID